MRSTTTLTIAFLTLLLIGGFFLAGYFLMTPMPLPPAPPTPIASPEPLPPPVTGPHLLIKRAVYGDLPDGAADDVTDKVAPLVARDFLSVAASNDRFGDPAPGIVKKLRIDYTFDGVPFSRTVAEDAILTIKSAPIRLVIKKALYGDLPDGSSADVTPQVTAAAEPDSLSIAATNDLFGDPAPGIVKKLRIDYTFDAKPHSKTVTEGDTFTVSTAGE